MTSSASSWILGLVFIVRYGLGLLPHCLVFFASCGEMSSFQRVLVAPLTGRERALGSCDPVGGFPLTGLELLDGLDDGLSNPAGVGRLPTPARFVGDPW